MKVSESFRIIKILIVTVVIVGLHSSSFAETEMWQSINPQTMAFKAEPLASKKSLDKKTSVYQQALILRLDGLQMGDLLSTSNHTSSGISSSRQAKPAISNGVRSIPLLLPDGSEINVKVVSESILPATLRNKFPNINVYRVLPSDMVVGGRLDMTPSGFHAMLQMRDGNIVFIDPVDSDTDTYASYNKGDQKQDGKHTFSCGVDYKTDVAESGLNMSRSARAEDSLLIYRIAVATTGEYTKAHGGTVEGAMSAISTTLNRVNQVLERDLGIHLTLVENNEKLIYTDAQSDPYTGNSPIDLIRQNQLIIDNIIGTQNYDIGHLFSASGGGIAAIGSVCSSHNKAKGISGTSHPQDDRFNLDFVTHELGHQLGATHTFSSTQGLCAGDRVDATAFEPGSGSTVMSYAGFCGFDNLQTSADAMFHIGSIEQVRSFTANGRGNQCGTRQNLQNQPPVVNAGQDYTIPARTPFELIGEAVDADGDSLVYGWEQRDTGDNSTVNTDNGNNALFRVYMPSNSPKRTFPVLQDILEHSSTKGETLAETQRSLRFSFVAQDGHNETRSDEMTVHVQRTDSRFALNIPRSQYTLGETYDIKWNVANTDQPPVNCGNIDIFLSTNGGYHFDQKLGENIINSGQASVIIPSDSPETAQGRFKISCSDNIFFAVSSRNFVLTSEAGSVTPILDNEDQPEEDLQDRQVIVTTAVNTVAPSSQGGGSFDLFLFFLSVLVFRQKLSHLRLNFNAN